jgi:hypothetical protein
MVNWSSWSSRGGDIASGPVVSRNLDGRLEVFVVWNNGVIGVIRQNSPNGGWSQWQAFPLDNFSTQLQPAVGRNADGHLELFATRLGEIYHIW